MFQFFSAIHRLSRRVGQSRSDRLGLSAEAERRGVVETGHAEPAAVREVFQVQAVSRRTVQAAEGEKWCK